MSQQEGSPSGRPSAPPQLVRGADLKLLLKLPFAFFLATCVPARAWPDTCDRIVRLTDRPHPGPAAREVAAIQKIARESGGALSAPAIRQGLRRNIRLDQLHFLASWKPRGWRADIRLEGRQHLDRALAAGKGAIVWVAPFVFASLVAKRALHEAGYRVHHLSREGHGFSNTRLAVTLLNPIRTRIEDSYLAERIVIPLDGAVAGAKQAIASRLEANCIVSIALVPQGARCIERRFHGGWLRMALGAPSFAHRTGAALLPVFSVYAGGDRFVTTIEPPLTAPPDFSREEAVRALAGAMADRVADWAASCPDQFCWHFEGLLRAGGEEHPAPIPASHNRHVADHAS